MLQRCYVFDARHQLHHRDNRADAESNPRHDAWSDPPWRPSACRSATATATPFRGVDLIARPGRLHGLLGPNGAGKTTLMRVLLGLVRRDAGTVRLLGRDLDSTAGPVPDGVAGFVDTPAFYPYLSGRRNLALLARLDGDQGVRRGATESIRALEQVGLAAHADSRRGGLLGRHAPASRPGRRAVALSAVALPRRADELSRPGRRARRARPRPTSGGRRRCRRVEQPRHGRGRGALRRAHGHQPRPSRLLRHGRRTAEARARRRSRAAHERRPRRTRPGLAAARREGAVSRRPTAVSRCRPTSRRSTRMSSRSDAPASPSAFWSAARARSSRCSSSSPGTPARARRLASASRDASDGLHASPVVS